MDLWRELENLSHYQHHIFFSYFDDIEDWAESIIARIRGIASYRLANSENKEEEKKLYLQVAQEVKRLQKHCQAEIVRLQTEGVPSSVTTPIANHAAKRIRQATKQYLDLTLKEVKDEEVD